MTPLSLVQVLIEAERFLERHECVQPPYLDVCEGDGKTAVQTCECYPLRLAVARLHVEAVSVQEA